MCPPFALIQSSYFASCARSDEFDRDKELDSDFLDRFLSGGEVIFKYLRLIKSFPSDLWRMRTSPKMRTIFGE